MADYPTKQYFGSPQTPVDHSASNPATTAFVAGTVIFDNTSEKYTHAVVTIQTGIFGSNPTENQTIDLFGAAQDSDLAGSPGPDDTGEPSSTTVNAAKFLGAFPLKGGGTGSQVITRVISLAGIRKMKMFLRNGAGSTMTCSGTHLICVITPFSMGITVA